jgi:hypothetical protein
MHASIAIVAKREEKGSVGAIADGHVIGLTSGSSGGTH